MSLHRSSNFCVQSVLPSPTLINRAVTRILSPTFWMLPSRTACACNWRPTATGSWSSAVKLRTALNGRTLIFCSLLNLVISVSAIPISNASSRKNRDQAAAVRFFKKAIGNNEAPEKITIDGSRASHQAVVELKAEGVLPAQKLVRTNKYLNNMIEQDRRIVKQRCYPMLGFKTFGNAEVTLSGIEMANKIKKGQFDTSEITGPGTMILQVWEAVLAA